MANRNLDRVLRADYLDAVEDVDIETLRAKRTECQSLEDAASYLRRLVQARLDIIGTELHTRASGESTDLTDLVERLPDVLMIEGRGSVGGRLLAAFSPSEEQEAWAEARIAAVSGGLDVSMVPEIGDEALFELADQLSALEREVSGERRRLHDIIDRLQGELVRRYKTGEASVEGLLA
jgi:hypothetical protein